MYWYKYKKIYPQQICINSAIGGLEKRKANQGRLIFLASTRFLETFNEITYFVIYGGVGIDSS